MIRKFFCLTFIITFFFQSIQCIGNDSSLEINRSKVLSYTKTQSKNLNKFFTLTLFEEQEVTEEDCEDDSELDVSYNPKIWDVSSYHFYVSKHKRINFSLNKYKLFSPNIFVLGDVLVYLSVFRI